MVTDRNISLVVALVVGLLLAAFPCGCDQPPARPTTADGKPIETVLVDPADAAEKAAVGDLLAATAAYKQALKVLHAYYVTAGNYDKQVWSESELANLLQAQTFKFEGAEAPAPPAGPSIETLNEAAVVEATLTARRNWRGCLMKLAEFYGRKGLNFKLALVRNIQARFDPIRVYPYFMHAEVPPATLTPAEPIDDADDLFAEAFKLHREGKSLPGITNYAKQRKALLMFRQLVDRYPTSTKIAHSAYYIAEIYKEYFDENVRAVAWYERAWQWDRHISLPARSQAAFVYDFRLGRHDKALGLYHDVIKYEHFDWNRVRYARQRIGELTKAK